MSCPTLTFANKSPFLTDQILISELQIQPNVPLQITATVTNNGASGQAQLLLFWASKKPNAIWPHALFEPTWVIPDVGSYNGQVQVVNAGPCTATFTTFWTPDSTVVPAPGAIPTVLFLFAQIVILPVLGTCSGSAAPWNFDMTNALNGAALFEYAPLP
jgi:hypothetical protein